MPNFTDAMEVLERIEPIAYSCGYTLAVYGSTLWKGTGADIDLMAAPWRADAGGLAQALSRHGYKQYYRVGIGGLYGALPVTVKDPVTDFMLDIQIIGGRNASV